MISVEHNLKRLNRGLSAYIRASGRTIAFGIEKQSKELSRALVKESRGLMPEKGAVRAERLEAFKRGEGIRISKAAREYAHSKTMASASNLRTKKAAIFVEKTKGGKFKKDGRNWYQVAVAREISLRESGRGFLAHSQRFGMSKSEQYLARRIDNAISRDGIRLGEFGFTEDSQGGTARFKWGGFSNLSNEAVKAMTRSKGQRAIANAIEATIDNMRPYLERKLGEDAAKILN